MSSNLNVNIGSGLQGFRKNQAGNFWGITPTVAVVNFEDSAVCEVFRESMAPIDLVTPIKLPSGINLPRRRTIVINNQGGGTVYIGGTSGVSITTGYPVIPDSEKAFEIGASLDIWAIASGVASEIRIIELA